ncbi:MAG: ferredoxin [Candidatus Nanopelagicales bacterium]|uniref:ferredoxin n=1 Tax=Nocardioides sp. LML1-1-1.1 TaxID=3135248 RepID=UPI00341748B4
MSPTPPRVTVDTDLCEGFGVCYSLAPELFADGPGGRALVRQDGTDVDEEYLDTVVAQCPRSALSTTRA